MVLFTRTKTQKGKVDIELKGQEIYKTILNGFQEMENNNISRIILSLEEREFKREDSTLLIGSTSDIPYYAFNHLQKAEQQLIMENKCYTVVALINHSQNRVSIEKGMEEYYRDRKNHEPEVLKTVRTNYITRGRIIEESELKDYAEHLAKEGVTKETIEQKIEERIKEYKSRG